MPKADAAAIALFKRPQKWQAERPPNKRDERRYFAIVGSGKSIDQVALEDNVSPDAVQYSLDRVNMWKARHSNEMVALKINEATMNQMGGVEQAFATGLKAKKIERLGGGKTRMVEDVGMQMKTVDTMRGLLELTQPRAPLIQNNTQVNRYGAGAPGSYTSGMSFESRIREARERRGLKNEDEEMIEAEYQDTEKDLSEELGDIGIDLNDASENENPA